MLKSDQSEENVDVGREDTLKPEHITSGEDALFLEVIKWKAAKCISLQTEPFGTFIFILLLRDLVYLASIAEKSLTLVLTINRF